MDKTNILFCALLALEIYKIRVGSDNYNNSIISRSFKHGELSKFYHITLLHIYNECNANANVVLENV